MAEGVGVEPTKHFISVSLVLKTRRPTGDVALPLLEKHLLTKAALQQTSSRPPPSLRVN